MIRFLEWLLSLFIKRKEKKIAKKKATGAKEEAADDLDSVLPFNSHLYTKSDTAVRVGIENAPKNVHIILNLRALHSNIVVPCYKEFHLKQGKQMKINSGYRCLELNRIIGSKDTSQHVKGQAVDIEFLGIDNDFLAEWIYHNLNFDQLIKEMITSHNPQSGWIHCSYVSPEENRNTMAEIKRGGAYKFLKQKELRH